VPTAQPALPTDSLEFDVELVPVAASTSVTPPTATVGHKTLGLTKREWMLVGIGAGALTIAVIIGVAIRSVLLAGS